MTTPIGQRSQLVDPRLRARRHDVLREQGRRRLRRVQAAAAILGTGGVVWAGLMSPLFDVDRVVVQGVDPDRAESVKRAVDVRTGSALATVDLDRVRAATEAEPWIDTAEVSRSWPGTVLISVTERLALAAARLPAGRVVLVDAERQLELIEAGQRGDLPLVVGAVAEARPGAPLDDGGADALELAALLRRAAVARGATTSSSEGFAGGQTEIVVTGDGTLEVNISFSSGQRLQARFGRAIDLDEKVRALASLLESDALSGTASASIDVRVPEAPVITRAVP